MCLKMSGIFHCKSLLHVRHALLSTASRTHNLFFLHNDPLLCSLKCMSSVAKACDQHLFRLSYLIDSCGLSPDSARAVSRHVSFETADKPDKVINFFKNQGFSKSQIAKLVKGHPFLLRYSDPEKTLLPKIDFLYSKGLSRTDLLKLLSGRGSLLSRGLKDNMVPCFQFLKSFLGSDDKVITAIKRCPNILSCAYVRKNKDLPCDYRSSVEANLALLQQYGASQSNIKYILVNQPSMFLTSPHRFKLFAEEVKLMGINPSTLSFMVAMAMKCSMSKSTLESKENAYKHWGLSKKDIFSAFVKFPGVLALSTMNIMVTMDFLVNEMGWNSSLVVQYPGIVCMSLKKRIVPRCSVIRVLWSKGLIKKAVSLHAVFYPPEKKFLQKFVTCYEDEAPGLLKLYQETLDLSE